MLSKQFIALFELYALCSLIEHEAYCLQLGGKYLNILKYFAVGTVLYTREPLSPFRDSNTIHAYVCASGIDSSTSVH